MTNWIKTELEDVSVLDDGSRVSYTSWEGESLHIDETIIRACRKALGFDVRWTSGSDWDPTNEDPAAPEAVRSIERGVRCGLIEEGETYHVGEYDSWKAAAEDARDRIDPASYDVSRSIVISYAVRDEDLDEVVEDGSVTLHPDEPECSSDDGHEWSDDHDLVGGCKENPGVWGSGHGSIKQIHGCRRCGCRRVTDYGATCPEDGTQMTRISYYEAAIEEEDD